MDTPTVGKPNKGYSQVGVSPPRLRCFVVNYLLEDLQNEGFLVYGYADDIAILVRGNFFSTVGDLINALKIVQCGRPKL
jgi:hypothetical protein